MKDVIKITRGSGNIFRDLGRGDADLEQLRAILAAKMIGVLGDRQPPERRPGPRHCMAAEPPLPLRARGQGPLRQLTFRPTNPERSASKNFAFSETPHRRKYQEQ